MGNYGDIYLFIYIIRSMYIYVTTSSPISNITKKSGSKIYVEHLEMRLFEGHLSSISPGDRKPLDFCSMGNT